MDVLVKPIFLFALGLFSLTMVDIGLCCGCTKSCAMNKEGSPRSMVIPTIICYGLLVICFISTHILYLGYGEMTTGFGNVVDGIDAIEDTYNDLGATASLIGENSARMTELCPNVTCSEGAELASADELVGTDGSFIAQIDTVTALTSLATSGLEGFLVLYVVPAMFVMYVFLIVAILTYLVSLVCKQKGWFSATIGHICWVIVAVCGIVWMVLVSLLADFCYENPTVNTIEMFTFGGDDRAFIQWYATCYEGRAINVSDTGEIFYENENPMDEFLDEVGNIYSDFLTDTDPSPGTAVEPYIELRALAAEQLELITTSKDVVYCPNMQESWFKIVNDGVCGSIFEGTRNVWIAEISSCLLLFFIIIFASILSRFYHMPVVPAEYEVVEKPNGRHT